MRRLLVAALAACLIAAPGVAHAVTWQPTTGDRLHIQLAGGLRVPPWATVVEIDGADTPARTVRALHARGLHVACYVSAGSVEDYRADAGAFPRGIVGRRLEGWPDERWLDTRRIDLLAPIMRARIAECASKGFDAIEFDNVDGWMQDTGFALTRADSLRYLRWLIRTSHHWDLAVGLKNALGLVRPLADDVDWALNEQCVEYDECDRYAPLVRRGIPVFALEYAGTRREVCVQAARAGVMAQFKRLDLGAWSQPCSVTRGP